MGWNHVFDWLTKWPTPWDVLASIAAFGAWIVNWLERRDRLRDLAIGIEPSAWLLDDGNVRVAIRFRNNANHSIRISRIDVCHPRKARCLEEMDQARGKSAIQSHFYPNRTLQPFGEIPAMFMSPVPAGHGDTAWVRFTVFLPEGSNPSSIRTVTTVLDLRANRRSKRTRQKIAVEKSA